MSVPFNKRVEPTHPWSDDAAPVAPPTPGLYFWLSLGSGVAYFVLSQGLHGHVGFVLRALQKILSRLA